MSGAAVIHFKGYFGNRKLIVDQQFFYFFYFIANNIMF